MEPRKIIETAHQMATDITREKPEQKEIKEKQGQIKAPSLFFYLLIFAMIILGVALVGLVTWKARNERIANQSRANIDAQLRGLVKVVSLSEAKYEENKSIEFTAEVINLDTRWHIVMIGMKVSVEWADGKKATFREDKEWDIAAQTTHTLQFFYKLNKDAIRPFRLTSIKPEVFIWSFDEPATVSVKTTAVAQEATATARKVFATATATAQKEADVRFQQALSEGKVTITVRDILTVANPWRTGFLVDITNTTCDQFLAEFSFKLIYPMTAGNSIIGQYPNGSTLIPAAETKTIPFEVKLCSNNFWTGNCGGLNTYTPGKPTIYPLLEVAKVETKVNCSN